MTRTRLVQLASIGALVSLAVVIASCNVVGTSGIGNQRSSPNPSALNEATTLGFASARASGAIAQDAESFDWVTQGPLPPNEELWIIAKHDDATSTPQTLEFKDQRFEVDDIGAGALVATPFGSTKFVPAPLQHTDVVANIAGSIASVDVTQAYANPFDVKIEAVYVFPLPQNSAVSEFVMTVGERRIRGSVRDREEAEEIYREARGAGFVASIMTQERPNIFTQKVANIDPGSRIDIDITYYHTLRQIDGAYEFVFPMTVGPRYNPPGTTTGVGAVAIGNEGASGQQTEITYLSPAERTGNTIDLTVNLDAGGPIANIQTPTHPTESDLERLGEGLATVRLADDYAIPNKDFVLRYSVRAERPLPTLVTHTEGDEGYFALTIHPPTAELLESANADRALELIFVIDTSGSMNGRPLAQAKDAIRHTLRKLGPRDAFQIIRFANDASPLGRHVVPATARNVTDALRKLESLDAKGGTEMLAGVRTALNFPHDRERIRHVVFLTDGYIGNEGRVLRAVDNELGEARLFSFGVGSSVNRFLMERLAVMGRGAAAFLLPSDDGAAIMDAFLERARTPALADISIDWPNGSFTSIAPSNTPDLYAGRPVTIMGRFDPNTARSRPLTVRGRMGNEELTLDVYLDENDTTHPALADLWARTYIAEGINEALRDPDLDPSGTIREIALEYALLSPFTAFIAVDASRVTEGDFGVSTVQPVNMPEGVRYETTVSDER